MINVINSKNFDLAILFLGIGPTTNLCGKTFL